MARLRQYLNVLNGWEETGAALEAYAAELPHLDPVRPQLHELLEQARDLVVKLNEHTASKQDAYKKLQGTLQKGQAVVDLIRTAARLHFGKDSEILVKFGVNPFRGLKRAKKVKPPANPGPATPEAPTSTPTPATKQ